MPLGVRPYRPAGRLPKGKADPAFHTKPELAWELIQEARAAGIPFRVVLGDCVYGEHAKLEGCLFAAHLHYVLALRPHRGTWQVVEDPAHPHDKPAKHELGWADFQVRSERAIVRHWLLIMLAFTFSLRVGAPLPVVPEPETVAAHATSGGKQSRQK